MASLELAPLDASSPESGQENTEDISRARHAREQALPDYHEDSGEYVSEANDMPVSVKPLPQRPKGRSRLSVNWICPPVWENLIALPTRFIQTC